MLWSRVTCKSVFLAHDKNLKVLKITNNTDKFFKYTKWLEYFVLPHLKEMLKYSFAIFQSVN